MYFGGDIPTWWLMLAMQLPVVGILPFIATLGSLYLGYKQAEKANQAQQRALESATQGLTDEEVRELRTQGTANIESTLGRRGLLDSGLLGGSLGNLEGQIGLAKAQARRGIAPAAASIYGQIANQPNIIQTLIPLLMKLRSGTGSGGRSIWSGPSQQPVTYS